MFKADITRIDEVADHLDVVFADQYKNDGRINLTINICYIEKKIIARICCRGKIRQKTITTKHLEGLIPNKGGIISNIMDIAKEMIDDVKPKKSDAVYFSCRYNGKTLGQHAFDAFIERHNAKVHWNDLSTDQRLGWRHAAAKFAVLDVDPKGGDVGETFYDTYWTELKYTDRLGCTVEKDYHKSRPRAAWVYAGLTVIEEVENAE